MVKVTAATKDDIKRLEKKINNDIGSLEKSLESRILESEVKILGELKDMREEFSTHQFSHMRINDELQEHDGRLKKLETAKI
jgi:hypothetical protein